MKKIFCIFLFMLFISSVNAQSIVYVSKKDINTNQFVNDCDFILYDNSGSIIDSWVQDNSVHVSFVESGIYKLIERDFSNDYLSREYNLNVTDDIVELTLYNKKIDTPRNLRCENNKIYCCFFLLLGCFFIIYSRKFYNN